MVASKRDNLSMKILRAKYKVKNDWLRSVASKCASPIWKAIESTKGIITKGACYLIGDGKSMDVWLDLGYLGFKALSILLGVLHQHPHLSKSPTSSIWSCAARKHLLFSTFSHPQMPRPYSQFPFPTDQDQISLYGYLILKGASLLKLPTRRLFP